MNRITTGAIVSLLVVAVALAWTTDHYYGNAVRYKDQRWPHRQVIHSLNSRRREVARLAEL